MSSSVPQSQDSIKWEKQDWFLDCNNVLRPRLMQGIDTDF